MCMSICFAMSFKVILCNPICIFMKLSGYEVVVYYRTSLFVILFGWLLSICNPLVDWFIATIISNILEFISWNFIGLRYTSNVNLHYKHTKCV